MRKWGYVVAGLVGACGGTSDIPMVGHHGGIGLTSGGQEQPPVEPSAYAVLPIGEPICQSDTSVDACRIRRGCNPSSVSPGSSAGTITFGTSPPTVVSAGSQNYVSAHAYMPGDEISIDAAGADIQAFSTSLIAPPQATILSRFDQTPLSAGQNLGLSWSGANLGQISVRGFYGTDGDSNYLDCTLDASPGNGMVSRAALDLFGGGLLRLYGSNTVTKFVGDWTIDVSVGFDAVWPDGQYAQGLLRLE